MAISQIFSNGNIVENLGAIVVVVLLKDTTR